MLNTYLNDNQSMAYPFYGLGALPFPMSVITGMGLCIYTENFDVVGTNRVYASNVQISKDAVNVAICRRNAANEPELIGLFYATTDGTYMYLPGYPAWIDDAVYENQTIEPLMLRYVYHSDMEAFSALNSQGLDIPVYQMQTFYSYVAATTPNLSGVVSTGYIQLGTIPDSAIGNYSGEFYIDPSCVTYMPDNAYKGYKEYIVEANKYQAGQRIDIAANGLLRFVVGSTVGLKETVTADDEELSNLPFDAELRQIESLRGYSVRADKVNKDLPIVYLSSTSSDIVLSASKGASATDPVIIEIEGTTAFPNCYGIGE